MNMIETIKIMLDALENHTAIKHPQQVYYRDRAIEAGRQAIAYFDKQEPVAWRETHGKVIKALASIVNVHTPDELFDLDAIPRDPVMALVQDIKAALDKYKPPQPKRERVVFPTILRKMWSGGEVQAWLDENVNKEKNT